MSWLSSAFKGAGHVASNVGHAVEKGAVDASHFAGKVASNPLVDGAVGLVGGPGAAALVGGLGHLIAPGGNLGSAIKGGVTGAAAGYAGSKLGQLTGLANLGHRVFGGGGTSGGGEYNPTTGDKGSDGYDPTNPTAGTVPGVDPGADAGGGGWLDELKKLGGGAVGGLEGLVKQGAGMFGLGGDGSGGGLSLGDLAKGGLLAGSVAAAAQDRTRQQGLQDKAISYATGDYDKNAALRDQARAMLTNNGAPDLSSVFSDPGNPYSRANKVPVNPAPASPATSPTRGVYTQTGQ